MSGAQLTWKGGEVVRRVHSEAGEGLRLAAEHLLGVARQQAPVDEGTLRASAAVTVVSAAKVAISFNTRYAVRQHEETGWRHPKGGKAKYLEDPLHDEAPTMHTIIATHIRRATK